MVNTSLLFISQVLPFFSKNLFFILSALRFCLHNGHNGQQKRTNSPTTIFRKQNILIILIYTLSISSLEFEEYVNCEK